MDPKTAEYMKTYCLMVKSRRAARSITRRYNKLARTYDLQATQIGLLFAISAGGFDSISELAERTVIERSAMTRNLQALRKKGLISSDSEGRGRSQRVALTEEGERRVEEFIPVWFEAHDKVRAELGEEKWNQVQDALKILAELE
ncbi:MarR family winged helix-turn-helix transcriptional regulator [uncultured Nisaea sp.]|jgi:DNA-binding MarR family transcriptional regulator|uniref:MarR family winged helix-turn-helix transcriptional regulator n=1 Tax=uncultured Nisaea sp. TaxID=538215 RepID=UPI0030ECDBFA|tara:strand:+ start:152 stop:586 length:435 start_codon:yes stop_codon:yes gene_type:complete